MYLGEEIFNQAVSDFFATGRLLRFAKKELIVCAGQEPAGVYLIVKGYVKVYSISDSGEENTHIIYGPNEIFPILWALRDVYRDIYCEALGPVTAWRVTREALLAFAQRDVATTFGLLNTLAEQFAAFAFRMDNLGYRQIGERLVYRLVFLASRFGMTAGEMIIIDAPITHQLLGSTINLSRESVSREFKKLENEGLVTKDQGKIVIKDFKKLASLLNDSVNLHDWNLERLL